jgi:hypothetical protein
MVMSNGATPDSNNRPAIFDFVGGNNVLAQ